jgi:hypothetical protein
MSSGHLRVFRSFYFAPGSIIQQMFEIPRPSFREAGFKECE